MSRAQFTFFRRHRNYGVVFLRFAMGAFYLFNGAGPVTVDSLVENRQQQIQKQPATVN